MMHAYHDTLPGFDGRQIWHDGCEECEHRGQSLPSSLGTLDEARFVKAWQRAANWNKDRDVGHVSQAERPLLETIWCFQVMFEHLCKLPIGLLPSDLAVAS